MTFDLRPADQALIDAAIRLGDWLAAYEHTTAAQVQAIRLTQAVLRRLPEDSPEVQSAEYEFAVRVATSRLGSFAVGPSNCPGTASARRES